MTFLPQIIITGLPVSVDDAKNIREFCLKNNIFAINWCHPNGNIGFIDASTKPLDQLSLKEDLVKIMVAFPYLQFGVTLMSGIPGKYNAPVAQFIIGNNKVSKTTVSPHFGHPPPKRFKEIS